MRGRPRTDPLTRLMAKVSIQDNGCWLWTGSQDGKGYGQFRPGGIAPLVGAHRVSYELFVGPIPEGLELDHLCFIHLCVNPVHLEPKTGEANRNAYRAAHPLTHCARGHERTSESTYANGRCRQCQAVNTKNWRSRRDSLLRAL